jgi:hypothetical protein
MGCGGARAPAAQPGQCLRRAAHQRPAGGRARAAHRRRRKPEPMRAQALPGTEGGGDRPGGAWRRPRGAVVAARRALAHRAERARPGARAAGRWPGGGRRSNQRLRPSASCASPPSRLRAAHRRPAGGGARAAHRRRRKPEPMRAQALPGMEGGGDRPGGASATPAGGGRRGPAGFGPPGGASATRRGGRRAMARRRAAARGSVATDLRVRIPAITALRRAKADLPAAGRARRSGGGGKQGSRRTREVGGLRAPCGPRGVGLAASAWPSWSGRPPRRGAGRAGPHPGPLPRGAGEGAGRRGLRFPRAGRGMVGRVSPAPPSPLVGEGGGEGAGRPARAAQRSSSIRSPSTVTRAKRRR